MHDLWIGLQGDGIAPNVAGEIINLVGEIINFGGEIINLGGEIIKVGGCEIAQDI